MARCAGWKDTIFSISLNGMATEVNRAYNRRRIGKAMPATARADIDRFLACRRIAVIGMSRNRADYSRMLWKAFRERGYEVVPVHNTAVEIDGAKCFSTLGAISPPPDGAVILLPPGKAEGAAAECA